MKQLRRTMLYVPGNNPGMIRDAHIYGSDCIMFDLEDSVSFREKDAARFLIFNALCSLDYGNKELVVRVNALDSRLGIDDLEAIVRTRKAIIRLPKTESAQDVWDCEKEIERIEAEIGVEIGSTKMMAAIESAQGVLNAQEIAKSSKRLIGIAIGAEDYVTDLKTSRSPEGIELLFGRSMVLLAARAAKIDAIDTVYSDINNEDGFRQEVRLIKQLGFDGKSVINPKQIAPVHEIFTPTEKEIKKSLAIVTAIEQAQQRGSGVIALNGKMIDKPVAERAIHLLELARASGALKEGDELNA
jgi:citrate lyase subunit beta/citryl-CoA lyase